MTAKMRRRLLFAIGAIAVLLLNFKQRDSYRCQVCFSTKDVFQWRLGSWAGASVPLTPQWERVTSTRFFKDFLSLHHTHVWKFAQGSPYYFFGTTWGGCAIGGGRHVNPLCSMYDSSPDFRLFTQAKLNDGSLTKSNVIALMSSPRTEDTSPEQKQAKEVINKFLAR